MSNMKMAPRALLAAVTVWTAGCGLTEPEFTISGKWVGDGAFRTSPPITADLTLNLEERGGRLTGDGELVLAAEGARVPFDAEIENGRYVAGELEMVVVAREPQAGVLRFDYDGDLLDDNTIRGRLTAPSGLSLVLTLHRAYGG